MKKKNTNKHADAIAEVMEKLDAITTDMQREESRLDAHYRLNAAWRNLEKARAYLEEDQRESPTNPSQK